MKHLIKLKRLWVGFSKITNGLVLLGVGAIIPTIVIFSVLAIDSKRIDKQQALIQDKYVKLEESYLKEHSISPKMKQLINLGLSDTNAYYTNKINPNDLFMRMYYRIYNK